MKVNSYDETLRQVRSELAKVSPSFCLAKWLHLTLYLHRGSGHSCHHPTPHKILNKNLLEVPDKLHNTPEKILERKEMLAGKQPPQCNYCWSVENSGNENAFSDRIIKSSDSWAFPYLHSTVKEGLGESIVPKYLEVSFSKVCQMQCLYCNPLYSSKWQSDIQKLGDYSGTIYSNLINEYSSLENEQEYYTEAFWNWWPKLIENLSTFRITGGEPLLHDDVWKVFELLESGVARHIDLIVNSNLSVPANIVEKFSRIISRALENQSVKSFTVVTSMETVGKKAEFSRYGLDFNLFTNNLSKIASCHPKVKVSITSTIQVFAALGFSEYLNFICDFRNTLNQKNILIDSSFLRNPKHLSLLGIHPEVLNIFINSVSNFMEKRVNDLNEFEVLKLKTLISTLHSQQKVPQERNVQVSFYKFLRDVESRKKIKFLSFFPELEFYWYFCEHIYFQENRKNRS